MIRRVLLQGWKAFDTLEFEPDKGVNFIVSRNGLGKSSLLQGLAWSVFGDRSGVNAKKMRRAGHERTYTTVELDLPGGGVLTIKREVGGDVSASVGSTEVKDLDRRLRSIVGANLDFAARAVALSHQTLAEHVESFQYLEDHLAEVFGIANLRTTARAMATEYAQIKSANSKLRTAARRVEADVGTLAQRSQTLESELHDLLKTRSKIELELSAAEGLRQAALREQNAARALTAWRSREATIRERVEALVESPDPNLISTLARAASEIDLSISNTARELGASESRLENARAALESLREPGALCPTCQRPLLERERDSARLVHLETISKSEATLARGKRELTKLRARAKQLDECLREAERLGPEPRGAKGDGDVEEIDKSVGALRTRASELDRQIGERQGVLNEIGRTMRTRAATAVEEAQRSHAIRREAIAQLTADLMQRTVDALMAGHVTPLAAEIAGRWKQVFGERGALQLSPKGAISMEREGHQIAFDSFSPGEQVVSMLALRFLIVAASTTSPFMLLDEPLEFLDPPNRRLIASVLIGADRPVEQLIVTTYEEALVRRIHAMVPETAIHMIG